MIAGNVGNGLAQRFPVRGAPITPTPIGGPIASPIGRPMPVWDANPSMGGMPVNAPIAHPLPAQGSPLAMAPPSGTAIPNGMNTLSPQVGNALRRYLGRAY